MNSSTLLLLSLILLTGVAAPSFSQAVRTFVSVDGADNANCMRATPCRTFNTAVAAVATGGEVVALDSGGYGPVIIGKSVSLIGNPGDHVALAPTTGTAITINATGSRVILRNLYLNSQGGAMGIYVTAADAVHLENMVISGFPSAGLWSQSTDPIQPTRVFISRSTIRDTFQGLYFFGNPGARGTVMIDDTQVTNNQVGVQLDNTLGVLTRTTIAGRPGVAGEGLVAAAGARVTVDQCTIAFNATGLVTQSAGIVFIANSVMTQNAIPWDQADGGGGIVRRTTGVNNDVLTNTLIIGSVQPETTLIVPAW